MPAGSASNDADTVHGAERAIADAMGRLREALVAQEQSSLPFDRAYVTASNPNETLMTIHSATFDFYSQVAPYQSEIESQSQQTIRVDGEPIETDLWVQDVYWADVPRERTLDGVASDHTPMEDYYRDMEQFHGNLSEEWDINSADDLEFDEQAISLETLPTWQGWTRRFDIKRVLPGVGPQVKRRRLRIVIPIAGAWRVYWQLSKCLNEIGLLAEVEQHLERWGYTTVEPEDDNGHSDTDGDDTGGEHDG